MATKVYATINKHTYFNATGDDIKCLNGAKELVILPKGGCVVPAKKVVQSIKQKNGIVSTKVYFVESQEGNTLLEEVEASHPGCTVVGDAIATQAYPGRVCSIREFILSLK